MTFELDLPFALAGDQPRAVAELCQRIAAKNSRFHTLLGVTGSGKTVTVASAIAEYGKPALVLSHNKTLAAQLYGELKSFFPSNAVEYFISYYDYYQPEAYVPSSDTYIEKEATVNEQIDRMRHSATRSLFERRDVIIVASVSCIYGLGSPESYHGMLVQAHQGMEEDRDAFLRRLVEIQYQRKPMDLEPGSFRVRGDVVEIWPAYEEYAYRLEWFGDEIEAIHAVD
ncbi:MAG: DEAD/DEAH box helicase family protein, partial [Gemmatimonadales bacterium]